MYKTGIIGLAAGLALITPTLAGANFYVCVDWIPSANPHITNMEVEVEFAPSGSHMNCIDGGRGKLGLATQSTTPTRVCSTDFVMAQAGGGCTFGNDQNGVEAVRFTGPWGSRQPGLSIWMHYEPIHGPNMPIGYLYDQSVGLFGDDANFIVCAGKPFQCTGGGNSVEWQGAYGEEVAIIWQPNGSALSKAAAVNVHTQDRQDLLEVEL